jgi:hypothetical protein
MCFDEKTACKKSHATVPLTVYYVQIRANFVEKKA